MAVDFTLSPEQLALRAGARDFATTVLKDVRKTIRQYHKPDERFYATRPFHKKAVEAGFVKGLFPKDVGGTDVPALDFAIAAEELAAVDVNVPARCSAPASASSPSSSSAMTSRRSASCPISSRMERGSARWHSPR